MTDEYCNVCYSDITEKCNCSCLIGIVRRARKIINQARRRKFARRADGSYFKCNYYNFLTGIDCRELIAKDIFIFSIKNHELEIGEVEDFKYYCSDHLPQCYTIIDGCQDETCYGCCENYCMHCGGDSHNCDYNNY